MTVTNVVPAEFILRNSAGGSNTYRAVRKAHGMFEVTDHTGPKSGLNGKSLTYSEERVWGYLYDTKEWSIVEIIQLHSFVSTLPTKTTFWAGFEFKGERYEVNSLEEACKLLGTMRAMLKLEEGLARKRRT